MEGTSAFDSVINAADDTLSPALAAAVNGVSSPRFRSLHPESPTATSGNFFETLTSSDLYKNTKVILYTQLVILLIFLLQDYLGNCAD